MSIEQKLQAFLNSAAALAKIESAIEGDVLNEANNLISEVEQEQELLPFEFGISAGAITFSASGTGVRAECEIEFNHEDAKRAAFWSGGKWPFADLIYIFANGYAFSSARPPAGIWHGRRTVAQTSRAGNHFVQKAVARYLASAPAGAEVEIDGSYT